MLRVWRAQYGKQIADLNTQTVRQLLQGVNACVRSATFHFSDELGAQSSAFGDGLLRLMLFLADFPDSRSEPRVRLAQLSHLRRRQ